MRLFKLVVLAAILVVSVACGKTNSAGPSPVVVISPTQNSLVGTPWSQLPPLSEEAKSYLLRTNIEYRTTRGRVTRWDKTQPIRVFGKNIAPEDMEKALLLINEVEPFLLRAVSDPIEADIFANLNSLAVPPSVCGSSISVQSEVNRIISGTINIAIDRPEMCLGTTRAEDYVAQVLAHEVFHLLGFFGPEAHTDANGNVMSWREPMFALAAFQKEALKWLYSVPIGVQPIEG